MKTPAILNPRLPAQPDRFDLATGAIGAGDKYSEVLVDGIRAPDLTADQLEIDSSIIRGVELPGAELRRLELTDTRIVRCDASNVVITESILHRVEVIECRLIGIDAAGTSATHLRVKDSSLKLGNFRFASFRNVCFDNCAMQEADFYGADLRGARFERCDLAKAQMSAAKLDGTDLRGSRLDNLSFTLETLKGVVIDSTQLVTLGWSLARALGVHVRDDHLEG